jgi:hypothetical protein
MRHILLAVLLLSQASFALAKHEDQEALTRIRYSSCNSSYKRTLTGLHQQMAFRIFELNHEREGIKKYNLKYVLQNYVRAENRIPNERFEYTNHNQAYRNFHGQMVKNLSLMKQKIQKGYKYKCLSNRNKQCEDGMVYAYVLRIGRIALNKIYLCPTFFKEDTRTQAKTLLHELSHLAADTDHYYGTVFTDAGLLKEAQDAGFYERMMFQDLGKYLKDNSWRYLWRKTRN